jgi:tetraacyldisaccharide 4'-kinase
VNPASALFGVAVRARNELYDRGMMTVKRLQGPVVSVGNLTVGGSGKTPFVIHLGELLKGRGIAFDVLSRGYGRRTHGVAVVGQGGSPRDYGDEPVLIARKLGLPVVVGEDRYEAGHWAEERFGAEVHLLDDGFQHRRLARDFDIVLIAPGDIQDSLLPAGRLREPLSSLSRADVVVLANDASAEGLPIQKQLVWRVRREIVLALTPEPAIAFCGIARPESFFAQLRAAGVKLAATRTFRDHHTYADADVRELMQLREHNRGATFLTTEKDEVNLGQHIAQLQPVHVVPLRMQLENAAEALGKMLATIAARKQHRA